MWFARPSLQSSWSEIVQSLSSRISSLQILIWMLPTWAASWNGGLRLMSPRPAQRSAVCATETDGTDVMASLKIPQMYGRTRSLDCKYCNILCMRIYV